ncbi:uncharacterized protein LOC106407918 [Brassica napus]|uniref:uncharacterized protein LOC106407918 n=1 Tax=Brassica napus TaxID=3708 RepID=UPI002079C088|nr:uncharacterized protein LOC106407918 [Brassica napus]
MQPIRRSSRLMKLKNVETTPMNPLDLSSGSSSRKRSRRRVSAGDTAPLPKNVELEVESLSDGESSDDHSDEAPMASNTPPNRSKEQIFEESRNVYQTKAQFYPELMRPKRMPMTEWFFSIKATKRFRELRGWNFIPQQPISLTDENLSDVRRIVIGAGLIHTLTDLDPYQPNVIREFLANLPEAEERDDGGVAVYVRGSLVDFSPSLINSMYCIPGFEEDPNWMDECLDEVFGFLTDGRIRRGENMSSKYLTATNQVLYKLVCSNWIPTRNYTSMNQRRLRFIYMLHHHVGFDFGKLVYDQIIAMAANTQTEKTRCIMFPNLIQQVIHFQRTITPDLLHDEFTGTPKLVVKDVKAGRGSGADSSAASLEDDINRAIAGLKTIRVRLRRGDYEQHVAHPGVEENNEQDEDEEDALHRLSHSDKKGENVSSRKAACRIEKQRMCYAQYRKCDLLLQVGYEMMTCQYLIGSKMLLWREAKKIWKIWAYHNI